jgi:hypothetical protein
MEVALVHPAVGCCAVGLDQTQEDSGRFPSSRSIHGPTMETKNSRTFRVEVL